MRCLIILLVTTILPLGVLLAQCNAFIIMPGNHQFHIPACEESVTVVFSVQVVDHCNTISNANITTYMDGVEISPSFTNLGSNGISAYLEFTESITLQNHSDLILVTYTDTAGNSSAVDALITVTQEDNPLFAPSCFSDINIALNADCRYTLLAKQVLGGCIGCLDPSTFNITVYDSDTTNSGIIDEAGSFPYRLRIPAAGYECGGTIHAFGYGTAIACNDLDRDGVSDINDNCPKTPNSDQTDRDGNGIGDLCEKTAGNDEQTLENNSGDIYVGNSARGLILKGFDNSCYRVSIDAYGNILRTLVRCP